MDQHVPELEQRLSELQAQVDRLSLSLHLWRQTQDDLKPAERRLAQLTERCAEALDAWTTTGDRHAHVVGELESRLNQWEATEARLEQDASQRIQDLGRVIEHEWDALRRIHEEPVKQLREQAASLTEVCIATASTAQSGFDRAESRLAALESEFHRRMTELSRELRAVVAELRGRAEGQPWALAEAPPQAWPLEGVMRLHNQLRQPEEAPNDNGPGGFHVEQADHAGAIPITVRQLPEAAAVLTDRVDSLERAMSDGRVQMLEAAERTERASRGWRIAVVVLTVAFIVAGALAWQLERRAGQAAARAVQAEHQADAVKQAADQRLAQTREDAARQIAQARASALKAQTVSDVLAAPDLVRYNLIGGGATDRLFAQVLWSRSHGLVFSGSRLPPPPSGATYQIWVLTAVEQVSAGTFSPDSAGRATFATDETPRVPHPVTGVSITIEPAGGRQAPSGQVVLARAPAPPTPAPLLSPAPNEP